MTLLDQDTADGTPAARPETPPQTAPETGASGPTRSVSTSPRWIGVAGLALVVAVGIAAAYLLAPRLAGLAAPHLYHGTVLDGSAAAPDLSLLHYVDGSPVDLAEYHDGVVAVYFGYTGCPDVCPTTLSTIALALAELSPGQRARFHLLMVSVDPDRDDPQLLHNYVQHFDPSFRGANGDDDSVALAASRYGVFYEYEPVSDRRVPDEYFVDHTATVMGIDTTGALRIVWSPTTTAEQIAADIEELLS